MGRRRSNEKIRCLLSHRLLAISSCIYTYILLTISFAPTLTIIPVDSDSLGIQLTDKKSHQKNNLRGQRSTKEELTPLLKVKI